MLRTFSITVILVILSFTSQAQFSDSTTNASNTKTSNTKGDPFALLSLFKGNPGRAALYSGVIPGAGQFYNKKYWKIPIVLAAEGAAINFLVQRSRSFRYWNQGLADMASGSITEFEGRDSPEQVKEVRDSRMQLRDYAIMGLVAVHIFQMAEAFVNRHLIEFDVSDDLSLSIRQNPNMVGLTLGLEF